MSANLTPAGRLADYTDGEIMRVLREGVDKDRRPLIMMGIVRVRHMSDEDLEAVIAYLRSQPAVENDVPLPLDQPTFLAAIMGGAGLLPPPQPPVQGPIVAPPRGRRSNSANTTCRSRTAATVTAPICTAVSKGSCLPSAQTWPWSRAGHANSSSPRCAPASIPWATN